jgi:uncharacterized protein with gpF-like domain
MPKRKYTVLKPIHPNAGLEAEYRARLAKLVREMQGSYSYFLKARYRANPPAMAMDAVPARDLERELSLLGKRWQERIDDAAPKLARWFTQRVSQRSQLALKNILKDGGISVDFVMTPAMRDVMHATMAEQVSLIKSIGSEYHTEISGMVMRSVSEGRDLASLTKELRARYGITERRANLIALSQNNLATSNFVRVRQVELGLKAKWLHSAGGKRPRPSHVANNGKLYDPAIGWLDPDVNKRIWPGTLISCRCTSVSVVPGFSLE